MSQRRLLQAMLTSLLALSFSVVPSVALADDPSSSTASQPLTDSMVSLTLPDSGYVYNGSPKLPPVTVKNGAAELIENYDYVLAYADNLNAGTATVFVSPAEGSSWTGMAKAAFTIEPAPIDEAKIGFEINPYPYLEGQPVDPKATVTLGETTLIPNTDYSVTYEVLGTIGTATVKGKGNYEGEITATFSAPKGHHVTFVDGLTGEVLKEDVVPHNSPAVAPDPPEHEGYRFVGWDKALSKVMADLKVEAVYEKISYLKITFVDGIDGTIFAQREVEPGEVVEAPQAPVHTGYVFYGWSDRYTPAEADARTTARYLLSESDQLVRVTPGESDTAQGYTVRTSGASTEVILRDSTDALVSGWAYVGGTWRYGDGMGIAVTGRNEIDGSTYYFDSEGRMRTGWIVDDDTRERVYAQPGTGAVVTQGWFFDGYGWYYAEGATKLASGWRFLAGDWYWFNPHSDYLYGRMMCGWVFDGSEWYWCETNGTMVRDRWIWNDGEWYLVGPSGAMRRGWVWSGNAWYYLSASGAMLHDAWTPDGCYVMPDGRWNGA